MSKRFQGARVAIFVPSMMGGGAERVMRIVANELASRNYSVDLLLAQKKGPYLEEIDPAVNVIDFGVKRVLHAFLPLIKYIRRERPVVLLSALSHANVLAVVARSVSWVPMRLVISERGAPSVASDGGTASAFSSLLIRCFYPLADSIIAVSDGVKKELEDYFKIDSAKVISINNPLELEKIQALALEEVNHTWLVSKDVPVFIAAGRLTSVKGFDSLLRAFSHLLEARQARLIILGEGPLREELLTLAQTLQIADQVHLVGFQPNPYAWLAKSDVFVLSSLSEGFPNILAQAMACGTKVVSTDCAYGPRDLLEGGRWGRLVPVEDVKGLSNAMQNALDTEDPPAVRVRASNYSVANIVDQYEKVLGLCSGFDS